MRPIHRIAAIPAVLALVGAGVGVSGTAQAASTPDVSPGVTNASLGDSGATQQRWLSVPKSRVVLNPYTSGADTELQGSSGNDLPLSTGFYAWDKAVSTSDVLTTYLRSDDGTQTPTDPGQNRVLWSHTFAGSADVWRTLPTASATVGDNGMTVRVNNGSNWSAAYSEPITVNPADNPKLEIVVPEASAKWSIKLNMGDGTGSDATTALVPDTSTVSEGVQTFDLASVMAANNITAATPFRLKIWASNGGSGSAPTVRVKSLAIRSDSGTAVAWSDDFDNADGWKAESSDVTAVASGGQMTVSLSKTDSKGYRFLSTASPVTANLDQTPYLSVHVTSTTGQWALKVSDGGSDKEIRHDTTDTGDLIFDLKSLTGWSGQKSFTIKLFQIGKGTQTVLDRMSVHAMQTPVVLTEADSVDYSWEPAALSMTGHYGSGSIATHEFFDASDVDAFVRTVDPKDLTSGQTPVVGGVFEGTGTSYQADTNTITVVGQDATRTIALPAGSAPRFYTSSAAAARNLSPTTKPTTTSGFWTADLPAAQMSTVGVSWAINAKADDTQSPEDADGPANSRKGALGAVSRAASSADHWASFWDSYVASVPTVQDFSVQRVDAGGVTADQMKSFYYKAWVNLEMNVLPATPETGNEYLQLGTGKPSLWMHGTPGTRNVASWDSLLGMQQLVYTDPEASWDSFIGMMESVSMTGVDPTDTNGVGTEAQPVKGALKGESLPSRKAQTAWILYSVTGDRDKLNSIYDQLHANLIWSSHNMRWIYGSNDYTDERDGEFVASLIYDLKFGVRIAQLLGHEEDATEYSTMISDLTRDYEDWFFPTTANGDGTVFATVQKVFLDTSRSSSPWSDPTEGKDYRDQKGRWVKAGWSFYTTTALVADQLDQGSKSLVMDRFMRDYDDTEQLAGLGHFAVKAPDMQLITYGLLDEVGPIGEGEANDQASKGQAPTYSRSDLLDMATVIVNSFNRDMVKSGWFAEVYQSTGDHKAGGTPSARGVRPSLFGISNYIDNIWIANGFRVDEGTPTVVRLEGATGGVSGLTYLGKSLNVDIDSSQMKLSGAAVGKGLLTDSVDLSATGVSVKVPEWKDETPGGESTPEPTTPGGELTPEPTPTSPTPGAGETSAPTANGSATGATSSPSASAKRGALAETGLSTALLAAMAAVALGGSSLLLVVRRRHMR